MIKTSCKGCIFKGEETQQYLDLPNKFCQLNKLDESKAEYVDNNWILNYFCNHCRNIDWMQDKNLDKRTANKNEILKVIREENTIYSDVIILINKHHTINDIQKVLSKIHNPLIRTIILSINNQNINIAAVHKAISKINKKTVFEFFVEDVGIHEQIKTCYKHVKSQYYIVVEKLSQYNDALPTAIDNSINEHQQKFCLILSDDGYHEVVMQSLLHKMSGGFYPESIVNTYKDDEWKKLIINQNQLICR